MRRSIFVAVLLALGVAVVRPDGAGAQPATDAAATDPSVERALTLTLARPADGPFVTRLVREARASAGGLAGLRRRLDELGADPARAFAVRVVEGHVARATREFTLARAAYAAAMELRPSDAIPHLGLARIARDSGDLAGAATEFEAAYERLPEGDDRRAAANDRGRVALSIRDFESAERWFAIATRGRPRYERAELARAYADAGEHGRAVAVLEALATEAHGDPREEAPALRDLGLGLVAAGRFDDALRALERARRTAQGDSGLVLEIEDAIVEAHRRSGRLDVYVDALAARAPRDAASIARIAGLAEELGRDEQALAAYQRLVTLASTDPEPRARMVRLLVRLGRVDEALVAERALVDLAPRTPRYFVPAIERLVGFGRMDEALALYDRVAARVGDDVAAQVALADLAERLGDETRLTRALEALVRIEPGEPSHRIALASERMARGERDDAIAMLDAALREASADPEDLATVATALAARGFARPAEDALRAAIARFPGSLPLLRAYADVLDPNGDRPGRRPDASRGRDAVAVYEQVLRHPDAEATERRDARRRILAIERQSGRLDERVRAWDRALSAGGDGAVEAGHFLLEQAQSHRPFDASAVQRVAARLVALAPRDVEAYLALERACTVVGDHPGAIAALERLVDLDPTRVDAYVDRLVSHAEAAYRDDDALRYALLGVERAPTDPRAEARLGDLLRRRRDPNAAMAAYRRALAIDDHRTDVWLSVAALAIASGDVAGATSAYDRVLRLATDDDSVGRAAEQAATELAALGRDDAVVELLLPHVASRPRVVILHRVLFVALERRVRALERAHRTDELVALGRRGVPVLLESLADRDGERAARAARLLGRLGVDSTFDALLAAAARHPVESARRAALTAAARLATPERAPAFVRLLDAPERRTRGAAALVLVAIGVSPDDRTLLLEHPDSWVRGAGLLAYELADEPVGAERLAAILEDERDVSTRALAILASRRHGVRFLELLSANCVRDDLLGRAARIALARMDSDRPRIALARVAASGDELRSGEALRAHLGRDGAPLSRSELASAGDLATATSMLVAAAFAESTAPDPRFLDALVLSYPEGATGAELALLERLAAIAPAGSWPETTIVRERVASGLRDPRRDLRIAALRLFPRVFGDEDASLIGAALGDPDPVVVRAALAVTSPRHAASLGERLSNLAIHHTEFDVRCTAALLARSAPPAVVVPGLEAALRDDPNAFVREAAATTLGALAPMSPVLAAARENDPEPRVREAARIPGPSAIRVVDQTSPPRLPMRSRSGPVGDRSSDG